MFEPQSRFRAIQGILVVSFEVSLVGIVILSSQHNKEIFMVEPQSQYAGPQREPWGPHIVTSSAELFGIRGIVHRFFRTEEGDFPDRTLTRDERHQATRGMVGVSFQSDM